MKNKAKILFCLINILILTSSCSAIRGKSMSISIIYALTAFFAVLLLIGYVNWVREKNVYITALFSSVIIINTGYFLLSISKNLSQALWANRVAYFGSVLLPLCMIMIVLNSCSIKYERSLPRVLSVIGLIVFLVAASPGVLDIFYKEVSFEFVGGIATLKKVYGIMHSFYYGYLALCIIAIFAIWIYSEKKTAFKGNKTAKVFILASCINFCVWFLEQLVEVDLELLSISYIITELFLLSILMLLQETQIPTEVIVVEKKVYKTNDTYDITTDPNYKTYLSKVDFFASQLSKLTPAEENVFDMYISGVSTKEILKQLNITENTLKFHSKNIYGKLGVSSRKELTKVYHILKSQEK